MKLSIIIATLPFLLNRTTAQSSPTALRGYQKEKANKKPKNKLQEEHEDYQNDFASPNPYKKVGRIVLPPQYGAYPSYSYGSSFPYYEPHLYSPSLPYPYYRLNGENNPSEVPETQSFAEPEHYLNDISVLDRSLIEMLLSLRTDVGHNFGVKKINNNTPVSSYPDASARIENVINIKSNGHYSPEWLLTSEDQVLEEDSTSQED